MKTIARIAAMAVLWGFASCAQNADPIVLRVVDIGQTSVTIGWDEPGVFLADGSVTCGDYYEIHYTTVPDYANFDWMEGYVDPDYVPLPTLNQYAPIETVIPGLDHGVTYYFCMRGYYWDADAGVTHFQDSNILEVTIITIDSVAPAAISDLTATVADSESIALGWTATGDDGLVGMVSGYEIHYSADGPILTAQEFSSATAATGLPAAKVAGSHQAMVVDGLESGTRYWFAIRAIDESGNPSALASSSPSAKTSGVAVPAESKDAKKSMCGSSAAGGTWALAALALLLLPVLRR